MRNIVKRIISVAIVMVMVFSINVFAFDTGTGTVKVPSGGTYVVAKTNIKRKWKLWLCYGKGKQCLSYRRKHGRYLYKMLHTVILWHHSDFRRNSVGRRSFKKSEDF